MNHLEISENQLSSSPVFNLILFAINPLENKNKKVRFIVKFFLSGHSLTLKFCIARLNISLCDCDRILK